MRSRVNTTARESPARTKWALACKGGTLPVCAQPWPTVDFKIGTLLAHAGELR